MASNEELQVWTLMHKNIPVANLEMIPETRSVSKVLEIFQVVHAPHRDCNRLPNFPD
ncbi:MAG: hypothetical protein FWF59_09335 [Turicibacter sp.]|nr:hypothetical protein [Turicibacter sp.]